MRLDRLKIGSELDHPKHQFKNLKNVCIDFDQDHWITVVIGWNGTGKSNVLEALAIIFRDLIEAEKMPDFAYELIYRIGLGDEEKTVQIIADPTMKEPYQFKEISRQAYQGNSDFFRMCSDDKVIRFSTFTKPDSPYLPRFVFSYYSGESQRMHEVFRPSLEKYYKELLNSTSDPAPKRLFYALPVHSQFVLLAFLIQPDQKVKDFLSKELGIDPENGIESVLFVLREPPWSSKDGDSRFWYARGLVQRFLGRLMNVSLAPISIKRRLKKSIWNQNSSKHEYQYLYVKDVESLRDLVGEQPASEFFRDLESTYVSELIEEVRIRVRLKKNDDSVTFRELSEGEQQLLTVLGLLRFTAEDESLFLLDEPDTHLNPRWSVEYLKYLEQFVSGGDGEKNTSHIVLTTHNPLAIAELQKEQIQILHRDVDERKIYAKTPDIDPRGMGYAGIVTSDMFGLDAALDSYTQELLEQKRELSLLEELDEVQRDELERINLELENYGFRYSMRDPVYEEYLRARYQRDREQEPSQQMSKLASQKRRELAKQLIQQAMQQLNSAEGADDAMD